MQVDTIIGLLADLAGGFLQGKLVDSFISQYAPQLGYNLVSSLQYEYYLNKRRYYATVAPTRDVPKTPKMSRRHSTGDLQGSVVTTSRTNRKNSVSGPDDAAPNSKPTMSSSPADVWAHDEFLADLAIQKRRRDIFVNILTESIRARAALGTVLQLVVHSPKYIQSPSWIIVWSMLGILRDCKLLPADMVLLDSDSGDCFPAKCRIEFEGNLRKIMLFKERALIKKDKKFKAKQAIAKQQEEKIAAQKVKADNKKRLAKEQQSTLVGSLVYGLGDMLFGASADGNGEDATTVKITEDMVLLDWLCNGDEVDLVTLVGRWDAGYESSTTGKAESEIANGTENSATSTSAAQNNTTPSKSFDSVKASTASPSGGLSSVQELISMCGSAQLIANSKYFSDDMLVSFLTSLITVAEITPVALHNNDQYSLTFNESTSIMKVLCNHYAGNGIIIDKQVLLPLERGADSERPPLASPVASVTRAESESDTSNKMWESELQSMLLRSLITETEYQQNCGPC